MPYCSKCGKEVAEDSSFCGNCGEKVGDVQHNLQNPSISPTIKENKLRNIQNNIKKPAMSPAIKVFVWIGAIFLIIIFIGIFAAILIPQYEVYKQRQENINVSAPAPTPVPSTALDISGTWRGSLEGNGEMVIKSTPTGFDVALSVSREGCAGSIDGSGSLTNEILTLIKKENEEICTITIKFAGDTANISEENCLSYHGAACGFSGTLNKVR